MVLQALKSTKYSALVLDCEACGLKKSDLVESACQMVIQWLVINFEFLILALSLVYNKVHYWSMKLFFMGTKLNNDIDHPKVFPRLCRIKWKPCEPFKTPNLSIGIKEGFNPFVKQWPRDIWCWVFKFAFLQKSI